MGGITGRELAFGGLYLVGASFFVWLINEYVGVFRGNTGRAWDAHRSNKRGWHNHGSNWFGGAWHRHHRFYRHVRWLILIMIVAGLIMIAVAAATTRA